jgi:hypothetical protein
MIDRVKRHRVVSTVAALAVVALILNIAGFAGGLLGLFVLVLLGAAAYGFARRSKRKLSLGCLGLLTFVSVGTIVSAIASGGGPQAQRYSGREVECGYLVHDDGAIGEYIILGSMNSFSCNTGLNAIQSNWSAAGGPVPAITNSDPISNYELNATIACDGYMGDYYVTVDSSTGDACSALGLPSG